MVVGFGVGLAASRAAAAATAHHLRSVQQELTQASVALPKWVHLQGLAWPGVVLASIFGLKALSPCLDWSVIGCRQNCTQLFSISSHHDHHH